MTFLECITRILRTNGFLRGDTDAPTSFSDTNHNASIQTAQIAVQDELTALTAERLVPYEKTSSTITLANGTRTYALAADFIGFYGHPHFYDSTANRLIPEWPGGQESLQVSDFQYLTRTGTPNWWYWEPTTTKKVGFYHVPDSTFDGRSLTYHYEKSVLVTVAADTMPFHNTEEANAFTTMAARRFKFMFEDVRNEADIVRILDNDMSYRNAKATLIRLMKGVNPSGFYTASYR